MRRAPGSSGSPSFEPIEVAAPEAERRTADLDVRLHLGEALAAIPPRQRTALVLRYYCDLSVEQTAEIMGCSPGTLNGCSYPMGLPAQMPFVDC